METTLSHLPELKQDELHSIVERIRAFIEPEMVILFGSYARGDYKEEKDLADDRKSGHASDYDILVITERRSTAKSPKVLNILKKECDLLALTAHPRIIAHEIKFVNDRLKKGHYFFCDIKKEGILLFDSGNFELAQEKKLSPRKRKKIAREFYDQWFIQAKEFYAGYEFHYGRQTYNIAAFNLHQATESCYKCILLVFTNYTPNEHHLPFLGKNAAEHIEELLDIFPLETQEQQKTFELLDYAYIGARYDPKYAITISQLEYLSQRIQKLIEITEKSCKEKML